MSCVIDVLPYNYVAVYVAYTLHNGHITSSVRAFTIHYV